MALNAGLAFLLLVLPSIQAYPSDPERPYPERPYAPVPERPYYQVPERPYAPVPERPYYQVPERPSPAVSEGPYPAVGRENYRVCELDLQVFTSSEIRGVFDSEYGLQIAFRALLVDDVIYSTTAVSDPDMVLRVQLSFPNVEGRVVPEIEKHVLESAGQLVESTACEFSDHLNDLFEELADRLYRCTESMGMSQLRFSIMYHETIVASAKRICNGAETICTASLKYVYGNELFICQEDMEELFPKEMEEARRKMAEARKPKRDIGDMSEARDKRFYDWCSSQGCGAIQAGDSRCCHSYDGCCLLCDSMCYQHGAVCSCCNHWFCGLTCQPASVWC